jgi:hypothetical protein
MSASKKCMLMEDRQKANLETQPGYKFTAAQNQN